MKYYFFILLAILCFLGCKQGHDPELEVPDTSGGYDLTPLGRLIFGPWQPSTQGLMYNVSVYYNDSIIASYAQYYSDEEANLVFRFKRNGQLQRWTKKDYTLEDPSASKNGITVISHNKPKDSEIRHIYSTGNWAVNYKDSTIAISSGNDVAHSINIQGKYVSLTTDELKIATAVEFDTTLNARQVRCKKVFTKRYDHPWIEGFE